MSECLLSYYEIQNTYDEWHSRVNARWATFQQALDDMENYSDWYRPRGTGTIYKITLSKDENGNITKKRKKVYER